MQDRLSGQILIRARYISFDASRLYEMTSAERKRTRVNANTVILVLLFGSVLVTLGTLLPINRKISRSISRLSEGANIIGSGNLDHRIGTQTDDEIGELSWSFDRMAANLQSITVSRDELAKEIAERKRAEDALRRSEAILKQAGQMTHLGAWEIEFLNQSDVNANPLHWSDEVYRIFGYEPGHVEVTNDLFFQSVHPEDREPIANSVARAVSTRSPYSIEHRIVRPDGSERVVLEHAEVIFGNGDRPVRIIGAVQDITERKRAEAALQKSKQDQERYSAQLEIVLNNITDGLVVSDMDGNLFHWNPAAIAMHGFASLEEGLRRLPELADIFELSTEAGVLPVEEWPLSRILRGETLRNWEVTLRRHATDWVRVFSYGGTLARSSDGKPLLAVVTIQDVTERKQSEDELKRLLTELERSNKELEQFAYVASHDLQEPLRMVASYVQLLERKYTGQLDDKALKYIYFAVDGAKRMQKLIDGLLAFSRVPRGAPFTHVDMNKSFSQAVKNLSVAIKENGAVVTRDQLPGVWGDEIQLSQLFQNLIGNSIKFRKPDVPPRIHVSGKSKGDEWIFSVQDNGIGIESLYWGRIFLIFQRLHSREEYPGTGIGLALCKRITERHHGRIWVESTPGTGSTFFFTIRDRRK